MTMQGFGNFEETAEILRRPGAKELYLETKRQAWIAPFLEVKSPILRRLGAQLLLFELIEKLDPERAARNAELVARDDRRTNRVEGRKRASHMRMMGMSFAVIARELGVSDAVARQWALSGEEVDRG